MRIGVECGGTFTDLVVLDDDGRLRATSKVFSTPQDPSRAVIEAIDELPAELREGASLLHGSTVATNALLERRGPRLGLLVTRGFRDLLTLQRQDRDRMYDLRYVKPAPLVPRHLVQEIDERVLASGEIALGLDEESARRAVKELLAQDVTAIAVCLLHSYGNPAHERRLAELTAALAPGLPVSLSCEVAREFREYERASTTVVDAFVRPAVSGYLLRLADEAARRGITGLQVMQSNGGAVPVPVVTARPVTMLLSGPAAGVSAAVAVAESAGLGDVVTMDMGGTSTDVSLVVDGTPQLTPEVTVDGLPVRVPMIDITTVGAAWRQHHRCRQRRPAHRRPAERRGRPGTRLLRTRRTGAHRHRRERRPRPARAASEAGRALPARPGRRRSRLRPARRPARRHGGRGRLVGPSAGQRRDGGCHPGRLGRARPGPARTDAARLRGRGPGARGGRRRRTGDAARRDRPALRSRLRLRPAGLRIPA